VCHVSITAPLVDWNVTHDEFTVIFLPFSVFDDF